jgi:hypothetical protein
MTITGSNVGIGTTAPSFSLDVYAPVNNQGIRINSAQAAVLYLYSTYNTANNRNWGMYTNSNVFGDFDIRQSNAKDGDMTSGGNGTSRLYIKNDGNVGIGTTTPGEKFTVQGPANNWTGNFIGSSTTGQSLGLLVTAGSNSTDWPFYTQTANSATTLLRVRGDGLIYTGLASLSPYNYGVSGGVALYVGSAGQLGYNSSIRESKENIKDIENIDWLKQLQPVTFNKKKKDDEGNYTEEFESQLEYGLIAEDVEIVNSDFVFYNTDGKLAGVHYDRLIAPMLKAIQELKTQNDALQSRIETLESK